MCMKNIDKNIEYMGEQHKYQHNHKTYDNFT